MSLVQGPTKPSFSQQITTLPNLIALFKIGSVPLIVVCIDNYSPKMSALASLLFLLAITTDFADAFFARKMATVTTSAKLWAALTSKILVYTTLVFLTSEGRVATWLFSLLLIKELAFNALNRPQKLSTEQQSKTGDAAEHLLLIGISFCLIYFQHSILIVNKTLNFNVVGNALLMTSIVLSIAAMIEPKRSA